MSDGKTDLDAVDRSLRSIIENLDPGEDTGQPAIRGSAEAMSGVTRSRTPESGLRTEPIEAGIAVSGERLVLRWAPYHHWQPLGPAPRPQEVTLIDGVSRIAIEYWESTGRWVSTWGETDLPRLIRVRIVFAGTEPPRWPDIVAAPHLVRP